MLRRITTCALSALLIVSMTACAHTPEKETVIRPPKPAETTHDNGMSSGEEDNAQSADLQMSGRYRVGADGKLLRPDDAPIPAKPAYPDEAHFETPEGAEAFIHYVIDSYEYMIVSADAEDFLKLCLPESQWCDGSVEKRLQIRKNAGWIEAFDLEILQSQVPFEIDGHPGVWNSDVEVKTNVLSGYDNGKIVVKDPYVVTMRFQMRFDNGRWAIQSSTKAE